MDGEQKRLQLFKYVCKRTNLYACEAKCSSRFILNEYNYVVCKLDFANDETVCAVLKKWPPP